MADEQMQRGGGGSVEFDESGEVGSLESRLTTVRSLAEDVAHSGELRYSKEITIDSRIWRVIVEQLPG